MIKGTGIVKDMSSKDYHSFPDTYSSSQLKDLLDDPEYFYKKYIAKEIEREEFAAFDIGTYFHTAILEPDLLTQECAVFEGIRRGAAWDKFKEDNKGKAIITKTEFAQAEALIKAVQSSPIAMNRIARGQAEVSAFVSLKVSGSNIFGLSESGKWNSLSEEGWVKAQSAPKVGVDLKIKVRADLLADNFILDLKSTTGNSKSFKHIQSKVSMYNYDLSASLYLDMFTLATNRTYYDFIWTFASKDFYNCKNYVASRDNIKVGRRKWKKAVLALAEGIETEWQFEDSLGILEPSYFEKEHLVTEAKDLL